MFYNTSEYNASTQVLHQINMFKNKVLYLPLLLSDLQALFDVSPPDVVLTTSCYCFDLPFGSPQF